MFTSEEGRPLFLRLSLASSSLKRGFTLSFPQVAVNTEHDLATREAALQIVHQLAEFKPKQLVKHGLVPPLVRALCMMCAEAIPEDWEDTQQLPAQKFASQVGNRSFVSQL